jgi:hypothetical protein
MSKSRKWLYRIQEDRLDCELLRGVESSKDPTIPIEEVLSNLRAEWRTRHRKPRKID